MRNTIQTGCSSAETGEVKRGVWDEQWGSEKEQRDRFSEEINFLPLITEEISGKVFKINVSSMLPGDKL